MKKQSKSALEVLSSLHRRPTSSEALSLSDREIFDAAKYLGFPLYPGETEKILRVQEAALPMIENILKGILSKEEPAYPNYYPLARDGELLYDALWGLGQVSGSTLTTRTHYTKASINMKESGNRLYFNSLGISDKRAKQGLPIVFLDSGFVGSLFNDIARWTEIYVPSVRNYRGYLVSRAERSDYLQATPFKPFTVRQKSKLREAMTDSLFVNFARGWNIDETICALLQIMPKFTGKYVQTYQTTEGNWDVLPQRNDFLAEQGLDSNTTNHFCVTHFGSQVGSLKERPAYINADVIDPVTSLLLQKRTLKYFSNPNIHDRFYSSDIKVV